MGIEVVTAPNAAVLADKVFGAGTPQFVSVHGRASVPWDALIAHEAVQDADLALLCATSCLGVMTGSAPDEALAAFVLRDGDGDFGSAAQELGEAPEAAAVAATRTALARADRPGEKPDLVWIASTPGTEEAVLAGIRSVVGSDVPVLGGTAADDTIAGAWRVGGREGHFANGISVAVLFPSEPLSFAYQNGYAPTVHHGTVTRAEGRRLMRIDGAPAAEVYAGWTGGAVPAQLAQDPARAILSDSTFWPLGREVAQVSGVPYHLLAHPAVSNPDGSLELFAEVSEGEVLTQMSGSAESLIARAGRVAAFARDGLEPGAKPKGALMIYCGGCMLSVRDRLHEVVAGIHAELAPVPFLGLFTFGEQGPVVGTGNRHGNLMISCIVFG